MSKYNIKLSDNKYDFFVNNSFDDLKKTLKFISSDIKIVIVSDKKVYDLYGKDIDAIITEYNCTADCFIIDENSDLNTIFNSNKYDANDVIIAVGGKSLLEVCDKNIIDIDIKYIKIPTSLNSIGVVAYGDIPKQLIGVCINSECLNTLEEKDFYSGIAYIMKTAITKSINSYMWIINNLYEISDKDPDILLEMLDRNFKMIKQIMDNEDSNAEKLFAYNISNVLATVDNNMTAGEYCALGIIASALISKNKEILSLEEYLEIRDMFVPFNLPITMDSKLGDGTNIDIEKIADDIISFSDEIPLLSKIGKIVISENVTKEEIVSALSEVIFDEEMDAE